MSSHSIVFVDTLSTLEECLNDVSSVALTAIPEVAIDLEGIKLSRDGRVAMLQILAHGSTTVWVLDITTLGRQAFDHFSPSGYSLRAILEGAAIAKLFFDVRNDSDALFTHYQVKLQNVFDVQLLDVAARRSNNMRVPYLSGLARCIEINFGQSANWLKVKEQGSQLFVPEKGGSYEVFEQRPVDPILLQYCAQDVALLFRLRSILVAKLGRYGHGWIQRVIDASSRRVDESISADYLPHGYHKATASMF